jgi:predicted O-methyltransferase YrrM
MGTQSINAVPARGLKAMSTHPANKVALKRMLGLMSTLHWKARYPWLIRLLEKHEHCKMSALCAILLREGGRQVFAGPFAGMTLPANIAVSGDPKYILGSYEEELHDVLNQIICMAPAHIIDIGAAGGYYAVGLAMKIANTTVTAFEAVEEPHWAQLAELASSNGVSRKIIQRGLCTADELAKSCRPDSFILCDCEGAEEDILQPLVTPALASCTMLVELHEFYRPAVVGTLIDRFRESHAIRIIDGSGRDPSRYLALKRFSSRWQSKAIEDVRWIQTSSRIVFAARYMLLTPKH